MLNYAHEFAQQRDLDPQLFEFEMLHGATPNRLKQMLDSGYRVRDYLPNGREWYLYVCHRLAEYPPNIYRALADALTVSELSLEPHLSGRTRWSPLTAHWFGASNTMVT